MKNLLFVLMMWGLFICLWAGFTSCEKNMPSGANTEPVAGRSSVWPTTISLGNDTTLNRTESFTMMGYSAYLNSCGTSPDTEAPSSGVEVVQLDGPTQVIISWSRVGYAIYPTLQNMVPGVYRFQGHAWVTGYRSCDDSTMSDHAYDTISITILKKRGRGR